MARARDRLAALATRGRRLAGVGLLVAAALWPAAPVTALAPLPAARPTPEQKRCAAAQRRIERQRQGLAQVDARIERAHTARTACTTARACERLERQLRSEEARRRRIERQLALYETEAERICAAAQ